MNVCFLVVWNYFSWPDEAVIMSGDKQSSNDVEKLDEEEVDSSYKPPPEKSLDELINADKEDESLQKYKAKLLGEATAVKIIIGE